jgi:tetratricopeptide (TPR) repeat protein
VDTLPLFVYYLALHRALVVLAGILCIFLGYRLFVVGLGRNLTVDGQREESISAEVSKFKFAARNLAPGTAFALFGAVVVGGMALSRPPEISLELLGSTGSRVKAEFRGEDVRSIPEASATSALGHLERGDTIAARETARRAAITLAEQSNTVAWVLLKTDSDLPVAFKLADAAVAVRPDSANFLHTLSQVSLAQGDVEHAREFLARAATIDPKYDAQLHKELARSDARR